MLTASQMVYYGFAIWVTDLIVRILQISSDGLRTVGEFANPSDSGISRSDKAFQSKRVGQFSCARRAFARTISECARLCPAHLASLLMQNRAVMDMPNTDPEMKHGHDLGSLVSDDKNFEKKN